MTPEADYDPETDELLFLIPMTAIEQANNILDEARSYLKEVQEILDDLLKSEPITMKGPKS